MSKHFTFLSIIPTKLNHFFPPTVINTGPQTPIHPITNFHPRVPYTTPAPPKPLDHQVSSFPQLAFLFSIACALVYSPHTTPIRDASALIITRGHIGGYDPTRQGQRFRQWNSSFGKTRCTERLGTPILELIIFPIISLYFLSCFLWRVGKTQCQLDKALRDSSEATIGLPKIAEKRMAGCWGRAGS